MDNIHATAADAELTLRLYDLRRESEMRKARKWFGEEFWPQSFAEIEQSMADYQAQHCHWFRQVLSYWDMAASLVLHGAYHSGLFYDTCGEAWFCYAKMKPFLQEARARYTPEFLANLEKVVLSTQEGRTRLQDMEQRVAQFAAMQHQPTSSAA